MNERSLYVVSTAMFFLGLSTFAADNPLNYEPSVVPIGASYASSAPNQIKTQVVKVDYDPVNKQVVNLVSDSSAATIVKNVALLASNTEEARNFDFKRSAKGRYLAAKAKGNIEVSSSLEMTSFGLKLVIQGEKHFGDWFIKDWQSPTNLTETAKSKFAETKQNIRNYFGDRVVIGARRAARVRFTLDFSQLDSRTFFRLSGGYGVSASTPKFGGSTEQSFSAIIDKISTAVSLRATADCAGLPAGVSIPTTQAFTITSSTYKDIAAKIDSQITDALDRADVQSAKFVQYISVPLSQLDPAQEAVFSEDDLFYGTAANRLESILALVEERQRLVGTAKNSHEFDQLHGEGASEELKSEIKRLNEAQIEIVEFVDSATSQTKIGKMPAVPSVKAVPEVEIILYEMGFETQSDPHGVLLGWVSNPKVSSVRLRYSDGRVAYAPVQSVPNNPVRSAVYSRSDLLEMLEYYASKEAIDRPSLAGFWKGSYQKLRDSEAFGKRDKEGNGAYFWFRFSPIGDRSYLYATIEGSETGATFGQKCLDRLGE